MRTLAEDFHCHVFIFYLSAPQETDICMDICFQFLQVYFVQSANPTSSPVWYVFIRPIFLFDCVLSIRCLSRAYASYCDKWGDDESKNPTSRFIKSSMLCDWTDFTVKSVKDSRIYMDNSYNFVFSCACRAKVMLIQVILAEILSST